MTTKASRLNMRLSDQALNDLRRAADICQQDLTSFVLDAALEKMRRIFVEEHVIRLPAAEFEALVDALEEPDNARLDDFYKRLKKG